MMMHRWIAAVALFALVLLPAAARAHAGHTHRVMGTISAVTETQLEVKAADDKTVVVTLDAKTVYRRGTARADATMLKVGERVVVEAEQARGASVMTAKTVQMAAAPAARAAAPAAAAPAHAH